MRRRLGQNSLGIVFAALAFASVGAGAAQEARRIGTVKPLNGTVYLHRVTDARLETESLVGSEGAEVHEGDALHFVGQGRIALKMVDAIDVRRLTRRDERLFLHAGVVPMSGEEIESAARAARVGKPAAGRIIARSPILRKTSTERVGPGKYFALVIGIDEYKLLPDENLTTSVRDAMALESVLARDYGFEVTMLLNADATRDRIMAALRSYEDERRVGSNDNLLIFFAGHGDEQENRSYWVTADTETMNSGRPIKSTDVTDIAMAIPARHVLVISDSCYAGGMGADAPIVPFSDDQAQFLRRMRDGRSRNLMASGSLEPVADLGLGGHSPFAYALLEGLLKARSSLFQARTIFDETVYGQVTETSSQTPKYVNLQDSKPDTGDFVFVRKNASSQEVEAKLAEQGSPFARGVALYNTDRRAEALALFETACKSGDMHACYYQGVTLGGRLQEENSNVKVDLKRAEALFELACNNGELHACMLLGNMWELGQGVPKVNYKKAETLFAKACDGDFSTACRSQGVLYMLTVPGTLGFDYPRAARLFRKACDGNGEDGCYQLGWMYENGIYPGPNGYEKSQVDAVKLYEEACKRNSRFGCYFFAKHYQTGDGIGPSDADAAKFFKRACDIDVNFGCREYAELLLHGGKDLIAVPTAAEEFLIAGCRNSKVWACDRLGRLHEGGEDGFSLDLGLAKEFYERACVDTKSSGCLGLGSIYEHGKGVSPNPALATTYYLKACSAGWTDGCEALKRLGGK